MHPDPAGSPTSPAPFVCDPEMLRLGVRARQKALRLSQQDIAEQTRLSEPTLSRFMSGQDPSDQTVNRLVHWLELELALFHRETGDVPEPAQVSTAA